ncbi:hypothetical protein SEA_SMOOCH_124 [Mycobacterium phage Smooch]|uniref:Uncharacterized protein n=1 Tax=Mycobacterium phage Smooch TaxID=2652896 RepID=A0A5P8DCB4_BPMCO|nr:hypothetical protein SEA_SMOOCH_124 [Mycobacterium phage Smooch]
MFVPAMVRPLGRPAGVRFPNTPTHRGARIGLAGATAPHRTGGPASDWRGQGAASDWRPRIGRRPRIGPTRARGASDPGRTHTRTRGARTLGPAHSDPRARTRTLGPAHSDPRRACSASEHLLVCVHRAAHSCVRFARLLCVCARRDLTCAYAFLFDFARVRDARDRCPCLCPCLRPCLHPHVRVYAQVCARLHPCLHPCLRPCLCRVLRAYRTRVRAGCLTVRFPNTPSGRSPRRLSSPPRVFAHVCVPGFWSARSRHAHCSVSEYPRRCVIPLDISPCQE